MFERGECSETDSWYRMDEWVDYFTLQTLRMPSSFFWTFNFLFKLKLQLFFLSELLVGASKFLFLMSPLSFNIV